MTSTDALIVEDEPVVLKAAGKALSAHGITFAEASDYETAVSQLSGRSFKLILTDLKLPGTSGFELIQLATTLSPTPQVVTITGYATIDHALESFRLGTFDFLAKPFDVDELISVVLRALRYFDLYLVTGSAPPPIGKPDSRALSLGRHSWALLDEDGTATLGAGESLAGLTGPLSAVDWVGGDGQTVQGMAFCRLFAESGLIHQVRAPLSGSIIATNPALDEDPNLLDREPFTRGWLARIIPSELDKEVLKLHRHNAAAAD